MTASVNINRSGYCTTPTSVNRLLYKSSLRAGPFQISPAASSHPEGLPLRTLALPPSRSTPAAIPLDARRRRARIPPPSLSTPAAVLALDNRRRCSESAATPTPPVRYASLRLLL